LTVRQAPAAASISASAAGRPGQLSAATLLPGLQRLIDLEELPDLQLVEGKGRQAYRACLVVYPVLITLPFRYLDYYVEFHDFCLSTPSNLTGGEHFRTWKGARGRQLSLDGNAGGA
jgi:hypothetical protein